MPSSPPTPSRPSDKWTFPNQVAPVQRPNPLKHETLIWAYKTIDVTNRVKMLQVIEGPNPDQPNGKPVYRKEFIASGRRLISARVDLMNGANFNDPAPFQAPTYGQLKSS